mmetsp:Transcript_46306/g.124423  ORF Transcript_46306/g.124423 Transcript_46306/m.124423 type:complete len:271 (-) Transcript_46306:232-1044(-)
MSMPAISSMAARRETMAFFLASSWEPKAMVEVQTTCMAMGMDATSSTTQMDRVSRKVLPSMSMTAMMKATRRKETPRRKSVMDQMIFWKWPSSSTELIIAAVLPKKVSLPVATTQASISPATTLDPILAVSPLRMVTGRDSPVMADWSTEIGFPSRTMQSAGTLQPRASFTMSLGTSWRAAIVSHRPSRFTLHLGAREFFRAAMASPALDSSYQPTVPLMTCNVSSTSMSAVSPWMASTPTASQIMMGMGPQKCLRNSQSLLRSFSASSL